MASIFYDANVSHFDTFIKRCQEAGITDLPLIRLKAGWKDPAVTSKLQLADKSLNPEHKIDVATARECISNGINVGCYGSPDGVEIHDIDLEDGVFKIPEDKIKELIAIFDTLTVKTRSGGYDLYFKNSKQPKNPHIFYEGKVDAGECRREWQYAVIPGSFVQKDKPNPDNGKCKGFTPEATGVYEIVHDAPLRDFDSSKAPKWYSFVKKPSEADSKKKVYREIKPKGESPLSCGLTDDQIIEKASKAKNSHKFLSLFKEGNWSIINPNSRSEADIALANMIAFYTDDSDQIERIMQRSNLAFSEKYDRPDYLKTTISKAIEDKSRPMWTPEYSNGKNTEPPREQITEAQIQAYRDEHIRSFSEIPELPDGFFKDYMAYGTRMSYAYSAFHFGNALALVSLIAGRKVCMKSTGATIYPNVFVACIGPTSTSGKSTACDMMYDQFFGLIRKEQALEELTKKMSPAGLLERLAAIPTRLWYYDECSEFFSDIANRWAESLESILCSVYDGRAVSYGLAKGKGKVDEYRAKDVFLTCVWNTTDSEMERRAQWSHVTNGFLPRFMWFWCHARNTPRANREISKEDLTARDALYKKIQRVRKILDSQKIAPLNDGWIVFKPHNAIEKWKLDDDLKHLDKDKEMHRIATARLMPQAYKIAVLFSFMDEDALTAIENNTVLPLSLNIPDKYANLAIDICEHYLRPRLEYLMDLSKNNDTKNLQIQVIRCLQEHEGIAKKSLVQHETHINKRNFDETITSLEESETIEVFEGPTTGGRKGLVLKLLK